MNQRRKISRRTTTSWDDAAFREGIFPLDDPSSAARGLAQIATDAAEEIAEAADRNAVVIDTDAWEALQRLMRPNETDPFFQQKAEFIAAMRREHSEFWHSAQLEYFDEGFTVESPLGTARRETIAYSNSSDLFGEKLLRDATIRVTAVTEPTRDTVCLHWSLAFVAAVLPWAPRCEWTGVSRWTLDYPSARALKQEDFWDSVDLRRGKYRRSARSLAWADVRGQLAPRRLFKSDVPELRYELLRRARGYELRRYEAHVAASVPFELWPVGVSALKRYVDGRNEEGRAVRKSLPMLVSLPERGEEEADDDAKRMACPLIPLETSAATPPRPASRRRSRRTGWRCRRCRRSYLRWRGSRRTGPTTARARAPRARGAGRGRRPRDRFGGGADCGAVPRRLALRLPAARQRAVAAGGGRSLRLLTIKLVFHRYGFGGSPGASDGSSVSTSSSCSICTGGPASIF